MINVLPVNGPTVGRESSQCMFERGPLAPAALTWLLTVVVSFESSDTGLFASVNANETEVFAIMCAETS